MTDTTTVVTGAAGLDTDTWMSESSNGHSPKPLFPLGTRCSPFIKSLKSISQIVC